VSRGPRILVGRPCGQEQGLPLATWFPQGETIRTRTEQAMPFEVETKDCTALSDAELAEMGDLCSEREPQFEVGFLSKQREEWVLITHVREGKKLRGYSFCTLERIGGTPALLVGLASIDRTAKADSVLKHLMGDQYRRALLAFPDEDVLIGTRISAPEGFWAFAGLSEVVPRPGHKATGEERAWARRLAKRFGAEARIDDRTFVIAGEGSTAGALDHGGPKVSEPDAEVTALLSAMDCANGDRLVVFGWAMAEDLASGKLTSGRGAH
jgi:hypothetical protein